MTSTGVGGEPVVATVVGTLGWYRRTGETNSPDRRRDMRRGCTNLASGSEILRPCTIDSTASEAGFWRTTTASRSRVWASRPAS